MGSATAVQLSADLFSSIDFNAEPCAFITWRHILLSQEADKVISISCSTCQDCSIGRLLAAVTLTCLDASSGCVEVLAVVSAPPPGTQVVNVDPHVSLLAFDA